MIIIGLTGPTGSGKTVASQSLGDNVLVINCDTVARDAVKKGSMGLKALTRVFGEDILEKGCLNRGALAKKAFASKENTALLNQTILPFITKEIEIIIKNSQRETVLLDAPTLFESGLDEICNGVIAVLSDNSKRLERITLRDNLTKENAQMRMNAGKDNAFYIENADAVVYNNGDIDTFVSDFKEAFKNITEG